MPQDRKRKKSEQSFERASAQHHNIKPVAPHQERLQTVPSFVVKAREDLLWKRFLLQELKK